MFDCAEEEVDLRIRGAIAHLIGPRGAKGWSFLQRDLGMNTRSSGSSSRAMYKRWGSRSSILVWTLNDALETWCTVDSHGLYVKALVFCM